MGLRAAYTLDGTIGDQRAAGRQRQPDQQTRQYLDPAVPVGVVLVRGLGGDGQP
jgi:hypothetical protein